VNLVTPPARASPRSGRRIIDVITSQNYTDTLFTLPTWHIASFGS
jgi:hypothetical protein